MAKDGCLEWRIYNIIIQHTNYLDGIESGWWVLGMAPVDQMTLTEELMVDGVLI